MGAPVLIDRTDRGVAIITLHRPEVRNAVDLGLASALVEAMAACRDARCIVITGADPAFCAGLDLRNLGTDQLSEIPRFVDAVATSTVPTIAAVNGAAVTGGLEIALACDFIVASDRARFADTHVRVGVYPGPVLVELPRRVGVAHAREMSMTGNFVDASTALRIGLANHVVAHDELLASAVGLASAIAENDAAMIATMRRDWDETDALPLADAHRRHAEITVEAGFTGATDETLAQHGEAVVRRGRHQSEE